MRAPVILLAVAFALTGCADDETDADAATSVATTTTTTAATSTTTATSTTSATSSTAITAETTGEETTIVDASADPSGDEVAGLLWMREEEQLAHDVYTALDARWDVPVFATIAASEQQHIESMVALLDRYGIDDPAAGNAPGTFTDPTIQQLYDDLVADGSASLPAALAVGARIEELDIADLRARAAASDDATIVSVYQRLERGSRNHLRAFVRQLDRLGDSYEPTLLDDFGAIVDGAVERGRDA